MTDASLFAKLRKILAKMHETESISWPQVQMITRTLHLHTRRVEDICVSRSEVVGIRVNASAQQVREAFTESRYSRLPVFEEDNETIVGILYARDWIQLGVDDDDEVSLRDSVREAFYVSELVPVLDALAMMRKAKVEIALCRDERGAFSGLITLEDIVEEVFDEIEDEYDQEAAFILGESEQDIVLDAAMPLEDFCKHVGLDEPEVPVDTVGGFVSQMLGRVPETGDTVATDLGEFQVMHSDGRRISRLRWLNAET